jgi:hypothetical protein
MASKTARTVILEAFQDLDIVADEESMTAAQAATGLRKLNDLMSGFESEGIRYAHTDLASLDTVVNVPDGQLRNLGLMLQRDLAGQYSVPLSPDDRDAIARAKTALQAFYFVPITAAPELAIRPRVYGRFNFSRG